MAAVGELGEEYKGKITTKIESAGSQAGLDAALKYEFGRTRHGLVGLDAEGNAKVIIKGHDFTKAEIREKIEELLR